MGWTHLFFVLLNFRSLGRLQTRLENRFPGSIEYIWKRFSWFQRMDVLFAPAVFAERAVLFNLAASHPEKLPVHFLGDDEVSALVMKMNRRKSSAIYRWIDEASGFSA